MPSGRLGRRSIPGGVTLCLYGPQLPYLPGSGNDILQKEGFCERVSPCPLRKEGCAFGQALPLLRQPAQMGNPEVNLLAPSPELLEAAT